MVDVTWSTFDCPTGDRPLYCIMADLTSAMYMAQAASKSPGVDRSASCASEIPEPTTAIMAPVRVSVALQLPPPLIVNREPTGRSENELRSSNPVATFAVCYSGSSPTGGAFWTVMRTSALSHTLLWPRVRFRDGPRAGRLQISLIPASRRPYALM